MGFRIQRPGGIAGRQGCSGGSVMARLLGIAFVLAVALGSTGCGFMEHFLGVPEAAPPLGDSVLGGTGALFAQGLLGRLMPGDSGQCIPSETDGSCNDTGGGQQPAVTTDQLAGIWVEGLYGAAAVHVDSTGSIRQVDLAEIIAGEPLPAGIPRRMFNVGQLDLSPDGTVTIQADLSVAGFSAVGQGTGYLDASLDAIYGITIQGEMTVLGQTTEVNVPNSVWLRWDPETGTFPYLNSPDWVNVPGNETP
jgi:hypothetical protein